MYLHDRAPGTAANMLSEHASWLCPYDVADVALPGFPDDEAGTEAMKRVAGDALLQFPNQVIPSGGLVHD